MEKCSSQTGFKLAEAGEVFATWQPEIDTYKQLVGLVVWKYGLRKYKAQGNYRIKKDWANL